MRRRFPNIFSVGLAFALTLVFFGAQALVPVCAGAKAAALAAHDCCAGQKSCHTQLQRSSCCEVQPGTGGFPAGASAKHPDSGVAAPLLGASLPVLPSFPKATFEARDLARRAQAPPLYLTKRSLLR